MKDETNLFNIKMAVKVVVTYVIVFVLCFALVVAMSLWFGADGTPRVSNPYDRQTTSICYHDHRL